MLAQQQVKLHNGFVKATDETVIQLVARALDIDPAGLTVDSDIGSVPEWDSLGHLTIVRLLEEEIGVELSIDDVIECESISDFIEVLSRTLPSP